MLTLWLSENALIIGVALIDGVLGLFLYKGIKNINPDRIRKLKVRKLEKKKKLRSINIHQAQVLTVEIDELEKELKE